MTSELVRVVGKDAVSNRPSVFTQNRTHSVKLFTTFIRVFCRFCLQLSGYSEQPVSMLLFIGTADDRYLRPHCFYQVHRVTGKTVTTSCQEKIIEGTKVLEIPLQPENNMSAR